RPSLMRSACFLSVAAIGIALGAWGVTSDQGAAIWTLLTGASLMLVPSVSRRLISSKGWSHGYGVCMTFGRLLSLVLPSLLLLSIPLPLARFTAVWLWLAILWYLFAEATGSSRLRLCWQAALFVVALSLANIALSSHGLLAQFPALDISKFDYARLKP